MTTDDRIRVVSAGVDCQSEAAAQNSAMLSAASRTRLASGGQGPVPADAQTWAGLTLSAGGAFRICWCAGGRDCAAAQQQRRQLQCIRTACCERCRCAPLL